MTSSPRSRLCRAYGENTVSVFLMRSHFADVDGMQSASKYLVERKQKEKMFHALEAVFSRPRPFEFYTAADLWTDEHTSERMLAFHLNEAIDVSSRNAAFIDRSVDWIVERFGVDAGTKVIDFGCGPGLYANRLARRGARVTGVDFSERSIRHARETAAAEGPAVEYVVRDYLEFASHDRFDLAMMIMCDFCALSPDRRRRMLDVFREHLAADGRLLLDVYSLAAFDAREEAATCERNQLDGFWSPNEYYGYLNTFKYDAEKVVLDKYTIVEAYRTRTVYNWLQHFTRETLAAEFTAAGFAIESAHGNVAGDAYNEAASEFAVVARKS